MFNRLLCFCARISLAVSFFFTLKSAVSLSHMSLTLGVVVGFLVAVAASEAANVDVSLAPAAPNQQVRAVVDALGDAREKFEEGVMASDARAFNLALQQAKGRIGAAARRAAQRFSERGSSGFLEAGPSEPTTLQVDVGSARAVDVAEIAKAAQDLEADMAAQEADAVQAWPADYAILTDFVVQELESAAPPSRDVRSTAVAGGAFVAAADRAAASPHAALIGDMEKRRQAAEGLMRNTHLARQLSLLQRENEYAASVLRKAGAAA